MIAGPLIASIEAVATADTEDVEIRVTASCRPLASRTVRRLVRVLAADCPRLDDVLQIASELIACAVLYPGPTDIMAVSIVLGARMARVTIAQDMAPLQAKTAVPGFGLAMVVVHGLADACHHYNRGEYAQIFAEVKW